MMTTSHFLTHYCQHSDTQPASNVGLQLSLKKLLSHFDIHLDWDQIPNLCQLSIDNLQDYEEYLSITIYPIVIHHISHLKNEMISLLIQTDENDFLVMMKSRWRSNQ